MNVVSKEQVSNVVVSNEWSQMNWTQLFVHRLQVFWNFFQQLIQNLKEVLRPADVTFLLDRFFKENERNHAQTSGKRYNPGKCISIIRSFVNKPQQYCQCIGINQSVFTRGLKHFVFRRKKYGYWRNDREVNKSAKHKTNKNHNNHRV